MVNARFVKPLDEALLKDLARTHEAILTVEEHSLAGGFGSAVVEWRRTAASAVRVERAGMPGVLVQHDSQANQRAKFGLSARPSPPRASLLVTPVSP